MDRPHNNHLLRKWKYDDKVDQHYLEVDESGELTKKYVQTKEEEEITGSDKPVVHGVLSLDDPAAIERGPDTEATANPPGSATRPEAPVEKQDGSSSCPTNLIRFNSFFWGCRRMVFCCKSPWKLYWPSRLS